MVDFLFIVVVVCRYIYMEIDYDNLPEREIDKGIKTYEGVIIPMIEALRESIKPPMLKIAHYLLDHFPDPPKCDTEIETEHFRIYYEWIKQNLRNELNNEDGHPEELLMVCLGGSADPEMYQIGKSMNYRRAEDDIELLNIHCFFDRKAPEVRDIGFHFVWYPPLMYEHRKCLDLTKTQALLVQIDHDWKNTIFINKTIDKINIYLENAREGIVPEHLKGSFFCETPESFSRSKRNELIHWKKRKLAYLVKLRIWLTIIEGKGKNAKKII